MRKFSLILLALLYSLQAFADPLSPDLFPFGETIRKKADFWKRVYSEIDSKQGFLHDPNHPEVVYDVVDISGLRRRSRIRLIKRKKRELKQKLFSIAKKNKENLNEQEQMLLPLIEKFESRQIFEMSRNIRWQQGLADRFKIGFDRSYLYLSHIKKIFIEEGVPVELSYLPHVESSFNYKAYSKVGAAGIWQFMRYTARLFKLRVNYIVDERLDPLVAARAAAKLLKTNFRKLNSWPLALTAYNHGANGLARAVKRVGSDSIDTIVEEYDGRRFGFASKNFFATFVASYELASTLEKEIEPEDKSVKYITFRLPKKIRTHTLIKAIGIQKDQFKKFNLSIRRSAYRNNLPLFKGLRINLPLKYSARLSEVKESIEEMAAEDFKMHKGGTHVVSRGETLYDISRLYNVSLSDIIVFNGIVNPSRILPGTKVNIPSASGKKVVYVKPKKKVAMVGLSDLEETMIGRKPIIEVDVFVEGLVEELELDSEIPENFVTYYSDDSPDDLTKSYDLDLRKMKAGVYRIRVQPNETLGHYADWIIVRIRKIRALNGLSRRSIIRIGDLLDLPISEDNVAKFNSKRIQYHLMMEEDFYENFRVVGVEDYTVRRGDTVQGICDKKEIPIWLLRKYQEDNPNLKLFVGQKLQIPEVEARD